MEKNVIFHFIYSMVMCIRWLQKRVRYHKARSALLRIDISGHSVNYTIDHNSETMLVTITCDIRNKRWYFSLSFHISIIVNKFDFTILRF